MINKKRRDTTLNSMYPIPSENSNKFYKLNYVKGISNKIINMLKKYNIRTTCININNIGKILTNNKNKTDKFSKSGICLYRKQNSAELISFFSGNIDGSGWGCERYHTSSRNN